MSSVAVCFSPSESEDSSTITNAGLVDNTAVISMGGGDMDDSISADNTALILMGGGDTHDGISAVGSLTKWINNFRGILSQCVYQIVPYLFLRWMVTMALGAIYALRVYYAPGYDMVSFMIGTFAVLCLGLFLTPKGDLELEELGSASLPVKCSDEFKPFVRRLPEFDFWYVLTFLISGSIILTFFPSFKLFGPGVVLFLYWLLISTLVIWVCVHNMIKYKYVPFSFGKQMHTGKKTASMGWLKLCYIPLPYIGLIEKFFVNR